GVAFGRTAVTVIATDRTPPERRGAAMGLYGLASAAALAAGPYLGGELVRTLGFTLTFLVAATIEGAALALAWNLPETRPVAPAGHTSAMGARESTGVRETLARFERRWFSRAALYPSSLVLA